MRGRSYSPSPPPRGYGRRGRSPSPRGRYGGHSRDRDLPTSLLVRNLRHDCRFVIVTYKWYFAPYTSISHVVGYQCIGIILWKQRQAKCQLMTCCICCLLPGQMIFAVHLGSLVLWRTFTCQRIIIQGKHICDTLVAEYLLWRDYVSQFFFSFPYEYHT